VDEDVKRWLYWAVPIVIVIGAGGALWYTRAHKEPAPAPVAQTQAPTTVETPVQHPVEQVPDDRPVPALEQSDSEVQDSLVGALGRSVEQVLVPKNIVRNVVVTVDNLPRKKAAVQLWPVKPIGGELAVAPGGEPTLSADNAARYEPFVKILKNADVAQVASVYRHFYPLFQQAYRTWVTRRPISTTGWSKRSTICWKRRTRSRRCSSCGPRCSTSTRIPSSNRVRRDRRY
jgi:Protein of unknown function (DUF3014).